MAAKFKLQASPTFIATVKIPVAGAAPSPVDFTFKHHTRDQFNALMAQLPKMEDDIEVVLTIASGWELADPFNADTLKELDQNYIGSLRAVLDTFLRENGQARLGN